MLITTDGIVIHERAVGENDKFLDILTGELGVVEISTKGVKKITGKNSSSAQLFAYSKFCLLKKGDRYILNSSEPIKLFFGLRLELERLALASYFAEIIRFAVVSEEPSYSVLRLFLNTLHFLAEGKRSCAFLKSVFELRLLCEIGLMPDLIACKGCSRYECEQMFFIVSEGNFLCGDCMTNEQENAVLISKAVLQTMRFISFSEPDRLFNFKISDKAQERLSVVTESYLLWQLGRSFKTLEFYKSLLEG